MGFTRPPESFAPPPCVAIIPCELRPDRQLLLALKAFSRHTSASLQSYARFHMSDLNTSDLKTMVPKPDPALMADREQKESRQRALERPRQDPKEDPRQRRLMLGSLCLLLLALGIVLWRDRDFWFPDAPQAQSSQPTEAFPVKNVAPQPLAAATKSNAPAKPKHHVAKHQIAKQQLTSPATPTASPAPQPPMSATATRTVLPPLEVEVVAGDTHRTIRPGSNSVHVDLQPGTLPQTVTEAAVTSDAETAAKVTSNAAERVQMSAAASDIVTSPVQPNYPLLARQMKVQGSVILQALISKDGTIQNLRVVSGPHILASAAQDAVRQWHFKPHLQGSEPVETQAKITVNFTISTN